MIFKPFHKNDLLS